MRLLASKSVVLSLAVAIAALAVARADDQQAAKDADLALMGALAKGDRQAAAALLDQNFSWTASDGVTRDKARTLDQLAALAANNRSESEVQTHFYGQLMTVRGAHNNLRFLRAWARRGDGWKAFVLFETPVAPRTGPASVEAAAGAGDCDNPCRTVPYTPQTAMDKAILAAWQATKMIEWKPDAEAWAHYIADEFMIINNTTIRNKPERVAIARKHQETGVGTPGDPILAMEIHDFGDNAAVMISQHVPYRGGKPYRNIRIWVLRDGRWQLAISQQATMQAAPPVAAVATRP